MEVDQIDESSLAYEIPDLSEIDETNVQYRLEELEDEKSRLEREIAAVIRTESSLNTPNLSNSIAVLQARARQCAHLTDDIVDQFEEQKRNAEKLHETFERARSLNENLQTANEELAALSSIEAIAERLDDARAQMESGHLSEASKLLDGAEAAIDSDEALFRREYPSAKMKVFEGLRTLAKRLFADLVCEISEAYRDALVVLVSQNEPSSSGSEASCTLSRVRFAKQSHRVAISEILLCVLRCRERAPHLFGRLSDLFDTVFNAFLEPIVWDGKVGASLALTDSEDAFVLELRRAVDQESGKSGTQSSEKQKSGEPGASDWDVDLVDPELLEEPQEEPGNKGNDNADTFSGRLESARERLDSVRRLLHFLKRVFDDSREDCDSVFLELVRRIESRLTDVLVEHVLKTSLPTSASQLSQVGGLRDLVTSFCADLSDLGFFAGEMSHASGTRSDNALCRYVSNICGVFAEKNALIALERARKLVRDANLFNTQLVPAEFDTQFAVALRSSLQQSDCNTERRGDAAGSLSDRFESLFRDCLSEAGASTVTSQFGAFANAQAEFDDALVLKLPRCKVSAFTRELVQLVRQSVEEAFQLSLGTTETGTGQFSASERVCLVDGVYEATRNVLDTFAVLVASASVASPQFEELPQSAAIQYCNAHYLAHYAALFQLYFSLLASGPSDSAQSAFECYTFLDVQTRLRQLGTECLAHQMRVQRGVLLEQILATVNFSALEDVSSISGKAKSSREPTFDDSARVFRQCAHQLESLSRVWRDVLPANVYRKCIAALVNECFRFLFDKVVALTDIGEYEGSFLSDSLASLQKHTAKLIAGEESQEARRSKESEKLSELEASRYVSKWLAIDELRFVLNATMVEIDERWCDAQGPLAQVFDASHLRGLIRALFENNERRAALLSKI